MVTSERGWGGPGERGGRDDGGRPAGDGRAGAALLEGLNPEQREAVMHDEGPLLILAGAGSGKTRVITHRIAYLIRERGVSPWAILAITFTNKAASEMKQRIADLVGPVSRNMWVGTFHSMFVRILRRHPEATGYSSSFAIIDSDDQRSLIRELMNDLNIDEKLLSPQAVHGAISSAKNRLISPEDYRSRMGSDIRRRQIANVYQRYQQRLVESDVMDFDDILGVTVQLFERHPEILAEWQARFQYILVDEYQDTNVAQYRVVKMLAAQHQNVCVVGDDDQSIYSFRGADIRNILDFEKDYGSTRVIKLEQNYRSTATVLGAANAVIGQNERRKAKRLWTEHGEGEKITLFRGNDHFAEARFVASEIDRYVRDRRGSAWRDVAILYRVNALSRSIELGLRERGIPYRIYGGLRFYDRKEIRDVLAYLRLLQTPNDDISLARIINVPRRAIGQVTVEAVRAIAQREQLPLLEVCQLAMNFPELARSARKLVDFAALIERLGARLAEGGESFAEFVEFVIDETGIMEEILNQQEKKPGERNDRAQNLRELISDAHEFAAAFGEERALGTLEDMTPEQRQDYFVRLAEREARAAADDALDFGPEETADIDGPSYLEGFLERASLYSEMDLDSEDDDHVRLMTIHSAKGLEFPVVFIVCAETGVFPSRQSLGDQDGMEEERRLAYVAITRAKQRLYITTARSRMLYGFTQAMPVSPFVTEIPAEYIREVGGSSKVTSFPSPPTAGRGRREASEGRAMRSSERVLPSFGVSAGDFLQRRNTAPQVPQSPARRPVRRAVRVEDYRRGGRLRHPVYGVGVVRRIEELAGDVLLEIDFGGRTRNLLAGQTELELLD